MKWQSGKFWHGPKFRRMLSKSLLWKSFCHQGRQRIKNKRFAYYTIVSVSPMTSFCFIKCSCLHSATVSAYTIFSTEAQLAIHQNVEYILAASRKSLGMPGFQTSCCQCCRSNLSILLVLSPNVAKLRLVHFRDFTEITVGTNLGEVRQDLSVAKFHLGAGRPLECR